MIRALVEFSGLLEHREPEFVEFPAAPRLSDVIQTEDGRQFEIDSVVWRVRGTRAQLVIVAKPAE